MLLNLHTHIQIKQHNEQIIYNVIVPQSEEELEKFPGETEDTWLSVGIHPWYINDNTFKLQLETLQQWARSEEVKFVGECGLDRIKGSALSVQEEVFIKQIRIAEELKKPIIIHCVKCFSELLSIKKIIRPKVPMIVHGFNNKIEIARQLLEKGFYLSLGATLMNEDSHAMKVLEEISLDKLFLETDDKEIPVSEIYQRVSTLKKITLDELESIIFNNYLSITI